MDADVGLHKILKDSTRRQILLRLSRDGSLSYMELMNHLDIKNTGKLNYHLKTLDNLTEKGEDGKYYLTERGQRAVHLLENYPEKLSLHGQQSSKRGIKVPKKFVFRSLVVMLLCSSLLLAIPFIKESYEAPTVQWQQFLPGISGSSVIETSDGGFLALGTNGSVQQNSGVSVFVNQEPVLVKTDSSGSILWTRTYSAEEGRLELSSIIQTSDGGYALGGVQVNENDFPNSEDKLSLIKIDSEGKVQWSRLLTGYNSSHSGSINPMLGGFIQTSDSGYAMATGYTHTMYVSETWFVKTDAAGNLELNKTVSPSVIGYPLSIVQKDNGYVVLGSARGRGGSGGKLTVTKIDSGGNVQWYKLHGEPSDDPYGTGGGATSDGGYVIGGYINAGRYGWITKTDAQGNRLWDANYSYSQYPSTIQSVSQTLDGGYIFVGTATKATEWGLFDPDTRFFTWVVKLDSTGKVQREKTIETGNYFAHPATIMQTTDKGYVFVGAWNETQEASSSQKFWLVKLDAFHIIPSFVWLLIGATALIAAAIVEIVLVRKFFGKKKPQTQNKP